MLRKTYSSLPKLYPLPVERKARPRCRVHCALAIESKCLQVSPDLIRAAATPGELARVAGRIYELSLQGAPRFSKALHEQSARHLIETIVEGLLQLTSNEIEGFSVCPLVTESIRCITLNHAATDVDVEVSFRAATLTYCTEQDSGVARAHDGHLELYRTYYRDVLLKYVTRRMEELLDPSLASRIEEFESHTTEILGQALSELRALFPLEPFQDQYENAPAAPDQKTGIVRHLCHAMRVEAKRRLGI